MLDERDVFMEAEGLGKSCSVLDPGLVSGELCSPGFGLIPSGGAVCQGGLRRGETVRKGANVT